MFLEIQCSVETDRSDKRICRSKFKFTDIPAKCKGRHKYALKFQVNRNVSESREYVDPVTKEGEKTIIKDKKLSSFCPGLMVLF